MKNIIAAILLAASLAACGGGNDEPTKDAPEPPSETSAAELPTCSAVWVDGKTIPADYEGCVGDDGKTVEANAQPCGSGPEKFVQYQYTKDEVTYPFIAILGEKVIEYVDDENAPYAKTFDKCGGEPVN